MQHHNTVCGCLLIELVSRILVVAEVWQKQVMKGAPVTRGHSGNVGIAAGRIDCLLEPHKALEMRLFLQITGRIGSLLTKEMSLQLSVVDLSRKPLAISLTE